MKVTRYNELAIIRTSHSWTEVDRAPGSMVELVTAAPIYHRLELTQLEDDGLMVEEVPHCGVGRETYRGYFYVVPRSLVADNPAMRACKRCF